MTSLELLERIRSGSDVRTAQAELYGLVRAALLERLGKKIPPQHHARLEPEEVLRAAFLKALAHLEGFRAINEHSFLAWIYSIAKKMIADALELRTMATTFFPGPEAPKDPEASRASERPTGATARPARREWMESVLARLPPQEAQVLRLRQIVGLGYDQIAAAWDTTPEEVRKIYKRAWARFSALAVGEG
ncbi:MAG: sigma-70 family RNA polymerase sigma factor [Planctomycetes bacterium]|nr:sigma-70 family RNA polymerase sigma factor [Planctomycetota bacterium]